MTVPSNDFDALVSALRSDLPSASDERRVRTRLLAAGVGISATLVAPGATASVASALVQKLGALSWVTKVGLAGIAVASAVPAAIEWSSREPLEPSTGAVPVAKLTAAPSAANLPAPTQPSTPPNAALAETRAVEPAAAVARTPVNDQPSPASHQAPAADATKRPSRAASAAAFPLDDAAAAEPESTLREETVLVERALYALRLGDRDGARRALDEHARRFPDGLLAPERDRALSRVNAPAKPDGSPEHR
jgi:hypothetical protein